MRDFPTARDPPLEPCVPENKESRLQACRNNIRRLAEQLTANEAFTINAVLNATEAELRRQRNRAAEANRFNWDGLPNEVKLMIYDHVLVQDEPIRPHVHNAGDPTRRRPHRHNLGASLLRTSKKVYNEALPVLLGRNTFEVNAHLWYYISPPTKKTESRNHRVNDFHAARALIYDFTRYNRSDLLLSNPPREEMERQAGDELKSPSHSPLHAFMASNPEARFTYLHEHSIVVAPPLDHDIGAVRINVTYRGTDDQGVHQFRFSGGHKINFYRDRDQRSMPMV